jgi:hypothetical protein
MTNFGRQSPNTIRSSRGTWILIGLVVMPFLINFFTRDQLVDLFALSGVEPFGSIENLILYPLAASGSRVIGALFLGYWLYIIAPALEREIKTAGLLTAFGVAVLAQSLAFALGQTIDGGGMWLTGAYAPVAALSVLWCARMQDVTIRIFFAIPVKAKWLAALIGALTFFGYGFGTYVTGLLMLAPLAVAWFWGLDKLPIPYARPTFDKHRQKKREDQEFVEFIDKVKDRQKEREDQERLRKLLEDSVDE